MTAEPSVLLVTKGLDLGGIERIVVDLACGLHDRGHLVAVALVNPARDQLVAVIETAGVEVVDLGGTDRIGAAATGRLRRLARRYQVVHAHGPLVAAVTRLAAIGSPVVTTAHTPWSSVHPLSRAAWSATRRLDAATVAVSRHVADSRPGDPVVISHGVDRDRALALRSEGSRGGPLRLVTVASHRDAKNYPGLLRALAAVDGGDGAIHLTAIGEGPGLGDHRRLAAELGLGDTVEFLAPVDEPMAAIAAADVLVVASDYEGQPLVVREALAVGTPVVATRVGAVAELIDDEVGRVVRPGDTAALAAAIGELARDRDLLTRLTRAAVRRPIGRTLTDVLDDHQTLYRRVAR